jgi:hypothetical protein
MRTYLYLPVCFIALLVVCLMFAPARLVTGDRTVYPFPAQAPIVAPAEERPFAELCRDDPIGALARSLHRYRNEVEGYTCTLVKQERINGKLRNREVIQCDFRESPFAVKMRWMEGKGRALAMLYPAGDRTDQLAVVPANDLARAIAPVAIRSLGDSSVREAARYPVTEFGLNYGTLRMHTAWQVIKAKGALRTRYDGLQPIPELNGKICHVLHRFCPVPEEEGLTELTVYFDAETLLHAGSVLKAGDELIACYYFNDLALNPRYEAGHFSIERLKSGVSGK